MVRIPLGASDFRNLRTDGSVYVDKTGVVRSLLASEADVTLFCRPRRFGKTLLLSTLRYYVERSDDDLSGLFSDLVVWGDPAARAHFQRYPVIHLSLKDVKARTWPEAWGQIRRMLQHEAMRLRWLKQSPRLAVEQLQKFQHMLDDVEHVGVWEGFLLDLSAWLHAATGERVVILIDEYDTPIHTAWIHGYYDQAIGFFRSLLGLGLKDNSHLFKGVLTGILRVAREGMFSGLNNPDVHSVLDRRYGEGFGFLEAEVEWLRQQAAPDVPLDTLRQWYNGYRIGGATVYNPWSILKCLSEGGEPGPYWVNTGSTDALAEAVWEGDEGFLDDLGALLRGESVTRGIPDATPLPGTGTDALHALLLHAGYLTTRVVSRVADGWEAELTIPNEDVRAALLSVVRRWMSRALPASRAIPALLAAMLGGQTERFAELLSELVLRALSFHDLRRPDPERVFHAFVLGLLVHLEATHRVQSNPESGHGRADVLVIPRARGGVGVVLEFKRVDDEADTAVALEAALRQISERRYVTGVLDGGAGVVRSYAIVATQKRVVVQAG